MKYLFGLVYLLGMIMIGLATISSIVYFIWLVAKTDLGFWSIVGEVAWNWVKFFFGGAVLAGLGYTGVKCNDE